MLRAMKVLGIGLINAFALPTVIGNVRRFQRPEKLVAYIGPNPGQRQSGRDKKIKLGVGKRGRGLTSAISSSKGPRPFCGRGAPRPWANGARKGSRHVGVAVVARKLLVQLWHLFSGNPA